MTAPSRTACTRASTTARSPCRPAFRPWCAATSVPRVSCSRWIRRRAFAMRCSSPQAGALVKRWFRVPSILTSSMSTNRRWQTASGPSCARTSAARPSRWSTATIRNPARRWRPSTSTRRTAGRSRLPMRTWSNSRKWPSRSRTTTAARWTSNGARTATTASCTSCRPGLRPCRAARASRSSATR